MRDHFDTGKTPEGIPYTFLGRFDPGNFPPDMTGRWACLDWRKFRVSRWYKTMRRHCLSSQRDIAGSLLLIRMTSRRDMLGTRKSQLGNQCRRDMGCKYPLSLKMCS